MDYASCPHLPGSFITSGTQTDNIGGRQPKRRAPQIAAHKYATVNTSTGSSTSGVDVSSVSSRSELPSVHSRKSVQIVETACTPDSPGSVDLDPHSQTRGRTSSFRNAIERGHSGDSSIQSFDTCEPASTSPDISPDHSEIPAYLDSNNYDNGYLHSHSYSHRQLKQRYTPLHYDCHLSSLGYPQDNSFHSDTCPNSSPRGILRSSNTYSADCHSPDRLPDNHVIVTDTARQDPEELLESG